MRRFRLNKVNVWESFKILILKIRNQAANDFGTDF